MNTIRYHNGDKILIATAAARRTYLTKLRSILCKCKGRLHIVMTRVTSCGILLSASWNWLKKEADSDSAETYWVKLKSHNGWRWSLFQMIWCRGSEHSDEKYCWVATSSEIIVDAQTGAIGSLSLTMLKSNQASAAVTAFCVKDICTRSKSIPSHPASGISKMVESLWTPHCTVHLWAPHLTSNPEFEMKREPVISMGQVEREEFRTDNVSNSGGNRKKSASFKRASSRETKDEEVESKSKIARSKPHLEWRMPDSLHLSWRSFAMWAERKNVMRYWESNEVLHGNAICESEGKRMS